MSILDLNGTEITVVNIIGLAVFIASAILIDRESAKMSHSLEQVSPRIFFSGLVGMLISIFIVPHLCGAGILLVINIIGGVAFAVNAILINWEGSKMLYAPEQGSPRKFFAYLTGMGISFIMIPPQIKLSLKLPKLPGFLNDSFSIILSIRKTIENTGLSAGFSLFFFGVGSCMALLYLIDMFSEKRKELDQKELNTETQTENTKQQGNEKKAKKRNSKPLCFGILFILCGFVFV